ncbi:hypothetical protein O6H91_09G124700 [Diphasiastrum complanatum]|uniref:Uncharacterized protein n=2 Tax=Diphasiastrum complanatum TaxID=34168 RepID=A0ACC2CU73_DIPCM|nr:hypothetical protein O6H91_09G124700 [Diphasiastrum complanatum]KAJ7545552.1 hypothetical protein O6H91_09G124700 [Diphasiastrum complanatum]
MSIALNPSSPVRPHLVSVLRQIEIPGRDWSVEPPNGGGTQDNYESDMAKYFEIAFQLSQEVVDMESFTSEEDRWVIEWFLRVVLSPFMVGLDLWHTFFVRLQAFKDCIIWFFSWLEEWESALDFVWRILNSTPTMLASSYFMELGRLFVAVGVREEDAKTLTTAADLLRASGQLAVTGFNFEDASEAYGEAVYVAILSKDFCKGGLILMEALESSELRNVNKHFLWHNETEHSLWRFLFLVAHGYQTENKFPEAVDLLNKGLALARQVQNKEWRMYLETEIEWELGEVLCSSYHHVESTWQEDGVDHWRKALGILGKNAPDTTPEDPSLAEWTRLMRKVRCSLGNWFAQQRRFKEAYDEYMALSQLHAIDSKHQLKHHLLAKAVAAYAQFLWGAREEGLMAYEEVVVFAKKDSDLQGDKGFQAEMLTRYSLLLGEQGDKVKSRETLDEARSLLCRGDLSKDQVHCQSIPMMLYKCLVDKDISSAFEFVELVDSAISNTRETSRWSHWNRRMARFCMQMKDDEEAQKRMELYLNVTRAQKRTSQPQPEVDMLDMNAFLKRFGEDFGEGRVVDKLSAEERFEILWEKVEVSTDKEKQQKLLVKAKTLAQNEWGDASIKVGRVSVKLASIYAALGSLELAEEENAVAMTIFEGAKEREYAGGMLGCCYVNEALRMANKGRLDEAEEWIDRAKPLIEDEHYWKEVSASIKILRDGPEMGEKLVKEVIDSFATKQSQFTPTMDSLWIQGLEEVSEFYRWLELYAINEKNCLKALLWVERSRTRLFMRISEEQAGDSRTAKRIDFDGSDGEAEGMIKTILEKCGSNVSVIEFSYGGDDDGGTLIIYVIYLVEDKLVVKAIWIHLLDELKAKWNKNLAAFVHSVMLAIGRKEADDKQAKEYLSYLHDILCIRYIIDHVVPRDCGTLVFAPHGHLSLLPLHALYDNSKGEYLIQRIRVCYTPSLRTLSHCFELQQMHDMLRRSKPLERAFVAGNPHPMGCKLLSLPSAEKEAKKVAEILGVQPCVREQMTKEAVKQGLCGSSIVLLATHADPGHIVLQGVDHPYDITGTDKNIMNDTTEKDEQLTANEMSNLPVRAALVVLDGCETGKGKLKSEGLLGLGRSVLQAGASTVVLSLWKVNDETTSDLVAGMFQNAIDKPRTVVESLRISMLNMLKVKSIYYWAPLTVVGSPTLCIKDLIAEIDQKEMVDTVDTSSSPSTLSQTLIQRTIDLQELDKMKDAPNSISSSLPGLNPSLQLHHGVMCDGCNTQPITGPRFRAHASYKENYDLCERCFSGSSCTPDQFDRLDMPNPTPLLGVNCVRESCIRGGQCHCIACGSFIIM